MPAERFEIGNAPQIVVKQCNGELDARGSDRDDTRLESEASPFEVETTEMGVKVVHSNGNCYVRAPEDSSLVAEVINGSCRVKNFGGIVTINSVNGSCHLRRTGNLTIGTVAGELRIREVDGNTQIEGVQGAFTARDLSGSLTVESLAGDFHGRNISGSLVIRELIGNLSLKSGFRPETHSEINLTGQAVFYLPPDADVRFLIPENVPLKLGATQDISIEDGQQIVTFGSASATVSIGSASEVRIKHSGSYDDDAELAYSFVLEANLSEHLANLTAQLNSQSEMLELNLSGTSDRIRGHIEKRLNLAKRQVEAAHRRVEREAQRAESGERHWKVNMMTGGDLETNIPDEPVQEEERMIILRMLEDGQIGVDDAQALLSALDGS